MLSSDTKAMPTPDVLFTKLKDGEAVLLHMEAKSYFSLNETGAQIWNLMSDGLSVGEISQTLEAEFDVTLERARQSVDSLVSELVASNLVLITS